MGAGGMEVIWRDMDGVELQQRCQVSLEAAGALSRGWKLSRMVQEMVEDTYDLYPEASLPHDVPLLRPAGLNATSVRSQGLACIMCLLGVLALGATIVYSGACLLEAEPGPPWLSQSSGCNWRGHRQRQTETDRDRQRQTETDSGMVAKMFIHLAGQQAHSPTIAKKNSGWSCSCIACSYLEEQSVV